MDWYLNRAWKARRLFSPAIHKSPANERILKAVAWCCVDVQSWQMIWMLVSVNEILSLSQQWVIGVSPLSNISLAFHFWRWKALRFRDLTKIVMKAAKIVLNKKYNKIFYYNNTYVLYVCIKRFWISISCYFFKTVSFLLF